jgi:hypothetical protein
MTPDRAGWFRLKRRGIVGERLYRQREIACPQSTAGEESATKAEHGLSYCVDHRAFALFAVAIECAMFSDDVILELR